MRIRKLTSLSTAALVHFFCGLYQSESEGEAFVNTIISSSSSKRTRQQQQQQQQQQIIISDDSTELNAYFGSNSGGGYSSSSSNNNNNSNDRQNNNHYNRRRKFDRKPRNDNNNNDNNNNNNYNNEQSARDDQRKEWLQKATNDILENNNFEPGTLTKGKWHELVSMMKGWSKLSKVDSNSPIIIERLIKRIHDEIKYGNDEAKISIMMYNCLLDAWCCVALFPTNYNNQNQNSQQSTTITPSPSVASQRARKILVLLQENFDSESTKRQQLQQQQQNLNTNTNTTEEAIQQQSNFINNNIVQPNEESFAMVFDVVLKVEGISAARRLLAWMEYTSKMSNNNNNNAAKPTIRRFYIRILNAYANSRDVKAGILAEGLLRHMNKIGEIPDTVCYNIAIKAWTKG